MGNAVVATRFDQSVSVETPLKSNNTITNLHAAKKKILFVSPELADLIKAVWATFLRRCHGR